MQPKQKAWLIITAVLQFVTAAMHSISFFVKPVAANDTEKQLYDLVENYKSDMGMGFYRSWSDFFLSFSMSFELLLLFGGLLSAFVLRSKLPGSAAKGIMGIQSLIFGACLAVMLAFTFFVPMLCVGLIFLSCTISWFTLKSGDNGTRVQ